MSATELLARSAGLRLFVMLRRTVQPALVPERLVEHLTWMIAAEQAGHVFLSGPATAREDAMPLHGITVLRVASLREAERLAGEDPFVKAGIVTFEMVEWTVNEGAIPVVLTLSDSTASIR